MYIYGGSGLVAICEKKSSGTFNRMNVHNDHLGSLECLTNTLGNKIQEFSFDPWGRRRNPNDWSFNNMPASYYIDRGYTLHEHLDAFGVINMNGRVYDPLIGRFLSPDNFVQAAASSQGYNRYSYCMNNPIMRTDPSGWKAMPVEEWNWYQPEYMAGVASAMGFRAITGGGAGYSMLAGIYRFDKANQVYRNGNNVVVGYGEVCNWLWNTEDFIYGANGDEARALYQATLSVLNWKPLTAGDYASKSTALYAPILQFYYEGSKSIGWYYGQSWTNLKTLHTNLEDVGGAPHCGDAAEKSCSKNGDIVDRYNRMTIYNNKTGKIDESELNSALSYAIPKILNGHILRAFVFMNDGYPPNDFDGSDHVLNLVGFGVYQSRFYFQGDDNIFTNPGESRYKESMRYFYDPLVKMLFLNNDVNRTYITTIEGIK